MVVRHERPGNTNVAPNPAELGSPTLKQHKPKEPPEWTKGLDENGQKKEDNKK